MRYKSLKHREIAKGCPEYISSVVEVQMFFCLSFWVLSELEFSSFVTICVLEFCHNLCFRVLSQFEFYNNLNYWVCCNFRFWVLSQFEFCHILRFWELSQSEFLSFVTISVFKVCHNLSWVLSHFEFLICHNLIFWVLSQFWVFEFSYNLGFVTNIFF